MRDKGIRRLSGGSAIRLPELIGDVYQAGLEPEHWPQVLARLSQAFEGDLACIYTPVVAHPGQAIYLTHNFTEAMESAYTAYYHRIDAWTQTAVAQDRYTKGLMAFGEEIISQPDLHRTEFYNDFLKPNGLEWIVSTVLFDGRVDPGVPATHMTFTRHPDHKAFGPAELRLIQALAPHVRRALVTHWRLTEARIRLTAHESALEHLGYGVVLLGEGERVLHLNRLAEDMLRKADGLMLSSGHLHAVNVQEDAALSKLLADAALGVGGDLAVSRSEKAAEGAQMDGKPVYVISALPLKEMQAAFGMAGNGVLSRPRAMLLIHDPLAARRSGGPNNFADVFHLTPAEMRVLALLVDELAPKQIAVELGVGIRTVRSHLSSLYTKTGTRNQRSLIALALRSGFSRQ